MTVMQMHTVAFIFSVEFCTIGHNNYLVCESVIYRIYSVKEVLSSHIGEKYIEISSWDFL